LAIINLEPIADLRYSAPGISIKPPNAIINTAIIR